MNQAVYIYFGVSKVVYDGLMKEASKGKYFPAHIKRQFPFEWIG